MNISMGWTSQACIAKIKCVTRRNWKDEYAARFKQGSFHTISNKDFRYGGEIIGHIEIIKAPYREPVAQIPASDYVQEGFEFYDQHPFLLPAKFRADLKKLGLKNMEEWFQRWPGYDAPFVVRFKILEITKEAEENLQQLLKQAA